MATVVRAASLILSQPYTGCADSHLALPARLSFKRIPSKSRPLCLLNPSPLHSKTSRKFTILPLATEADEATTDTEGAQEGSESEIPTDSDGSIPNTEETKEKTESAIVTLLKSYREAVINNNESKITEIESVLLSIEEEKNSLLTRVTALITELATERDRILRISADFDNFRKRTQRERLSLMSNAQGEVIESLLPVLDNFERAKMQIKVETEGEEKINTSYQSIYRQFLEILTNVGVEDVQTVGTAFDPSFHEAIMREESTEYEEGIIIQEFRKGFKLGERLLRPAMVKVSAGPGPAKSDDAKPDDSGPAAAEEIAFNDQKEKEKESVEEAADDGGDADD